MAVSRGTVAYLPGHSSYNGSHAVKKLAVAEGVGATEIVVNEKAMLNKANCRQQRKILVSLSLPYSF